LGTAWVNHAPPTTEEQIVDYSRGDRRRFTVTQILIILAYTVGFVFVVMGRSEIGALHRRALTLAPNGNFVLFCETLKKSTEDVESQHSAASLGSVRHYFGERRS
jgi:hypothetical protein